MKDSVMFDPGLVSYVLVFGPNSTESLRQRRPRRPVSMCAGGTFPGVTDAAPRRPAPPPRRAPPLGVVRPRLGLRARAVGGVCAAHVAPCHGPSPQTSALSQAAIAPSGLLASRARLSG